MAKLRKDNARYWWGCEALGSWGMWVNLVSMETLAIRDSPLWSFHPAEWTDRALPIFSGHRTITSLGNTTILQLKALFPNVLTKRSPHTDLPVLACLFLTRAWRIFRTEQPPQPSNKQHDLLLDSCYSLGKGYTAPAAGCPPSGPLALAGVRPSPSG